MYGENAMINDRKFMQVFKNMLFVVLSLFNSCSDLNKLLYKNDVKGLNLSKVKLILGTEN